MTGHTVHPRPSPGCMMWWHSHNESLGSSRHSSLAGVGVGSGEDVPQFGDDSLLSEGEVVLWAQGKVPDQTNQSLENKNKTAMES